MKSQLSIFDYPNSPGYKTGGTSKAAAIKMRARAPTLRERCLEVLQHYAFTSDEVAHSLGESILSIRPRISELYRMGLIYDTGTRRSNESDILATVWKAWGGKEAE